MDKGVDAVQVMIAVHRQSKALEQLSQLGAGTVENPVIPMQTPEELVTCQDIQRASVLPLKLIETVYPHASQCSQQYPLGGFDGFDNFDYLPLYLPSNRPKRLPQPTENPPSPTLPTPTSSNSALSAKGRGHYIPEFVAITKRF
ncbi:hypothetical protein BM1_01727 [Bipolaris maydis]|nr:hypothetical protein BM1_01727 [Bipolaris maydis]